MPCRAAFREAADQLRQGNRSALFPVPVDQGQEEGCPLTVVNTTFTLYPVIRTFGDSETERFYTTGQSRRMPPQIRKRSAMRLIQLNAAVQIEDLLLPPSNRLEQLRGNRAGQWSIRINDQWRVCFRFENGDAFDVEIVDYH
jgi:proteic killer suppression protein